MPQIGVSIRSVESALDSGNARPMAHLFNPQLLNALQFLSFGLLLVGVAVWHRRALAIALGGLAAMLALVLLESGLSDGSHKLAFTFLTSGSP